MTENRDEVWGCCFCGFKITRLHDPFAVRLTLTNLHRDPESPASAWHVMFAHGECVKEQARGFVGFDARDLDEVISAEDFPDDG